MTLVVRRFSLAGGFVLSKEVGGGALGGSLAVAGLCAFVEQVDTRTAALRLTVVDLTVGAAIVVPLGALLWSTFPAYFAIICVRIWVQLLAHRNVIYWLTLLQFFQDPGDVSRLPYICTQCFVDRLIVFTLGAEEVDAVLLQLFIQVDAVLR